MLTIRLRTFPTVSVSKNAILASTELI